MMEQCTALRLNGEPCRARPTTSGRCWAHDPALAERRYEARRFGGQMAGLRTRQQEPIDLPDVDLPMVAKRIQRGIVDVQEKRMAARDLTSMAAGARALEGLVM